MSINKLFSLATWHFFAFLLTFAVLFLPLGAANAITNTQSIDFEKSSSQYAYITDANQTGLDLSTTLTIEAWIKLEAFTGSETGYVIAGKYKHSTNERSYRLSLYEPSGDPQAGKLEFNVSSDGTTSSGQLMNFRTDNAVIAANTWYHVAVTFDASTETAKFYVDGDQVNSSLYSGTSLGATIYNGSQDFVIGASVPAHEPFDGLIDEVQIWNDVRTETEIESDMVTSLDGNESGLVGYWDFNATSTDKTSNGNDLTLSSSPSYSEEPANKLSCSLNTSSFFDGSLSEFLSCLALFF